MSVKIFGKITGVGRSMGNYVLVIGEHTGIPGRDNAKLELILEPNAAFALYQSVIKRTKGGPAPDALIPRLVGHPIKIEIGM